VKLIRADEGLFRLNDEYRKKKDWFGPSTGEPVRFILSGEVSSIYQRKGRVRKVHNG